MIVLKSLSFFTLSVKRGNVTRPHHRQDRRGKRDPSWWSATRLKRVSQCSHERVVHTQYSLASQQSVGHRVCSVSPYWLVCRHTYLSREVERLSMPKKKRWVKHLPLIPASTWMPAAQMADILRSKTDIQARELSNRLKGCCWGLEQAFRAVLRQGIQGNTQSTITSR